MAEREDKEGLAEGFFVGTRERDGAQLVRDASKIALSKRFYTTVSVEEKAGAFEVMLDGRPVKSPRQTTVALPTREAADLIAAEWAAQADTIKPASMPATRIVNAALDGVASDVGAVAADIVKYAGSDLVCYRAGEPPALVSAQAVAWDPVIAFANDTLDARMALTEGVMFVAQPPEAIAAIASAVGAIAREANAVLRIAALHVVTTLTGSALIALAVEAGALSCEEAWSAAHVDEDEQMRVWGLDAEALRRRAARFADMRAACALLTAIP